MAFHNFSEPVEIIVDRYFKRKSFHDSNSSSASFAPAATQLARAEPQDSSLPHIPCTIIRDSNGRPSRFIYGELSLLSSPLESDPVIWQQQLFRNPDGSLSHIVTTYPDGSSVSTQLIRSDGLLSSYDFLL